jgi:hypothetical protein
VFVPRYALPSILGVTLAMVSLVKRCSGSQAAPPVVLAMVLASWFGFTRLREFHSRKMEKAAFTETLARLEADPSQSPVVIDSEYLFLKTWYYAPPGLWPRLVLGDTSGTAGDRLVALTRNRPFPIRAWTPEDVRRQPGPLLAYLEGAITYKRDGWGSPEQAVPLFASADWDVEEPAEGSPNVYPIKRKTRDRP